MIGKYGYGKRLELNDLLDTINNKNEYSYTTFTDFNKDMPSCLVHRYINCTLSNNWLNLNGKYVEIDGLSNRCDSYNFGLTISNPPPDLQKVQDIYDFGFILKKTRDTNYQMFIVNNLVNIWYIYKFVEQSNCPKRINIIINKSHEYIKDLVHCFSKNLSIEINIIEYERPIYFKYLFVPAPITINCINSFPKINPDISIVFRNMNTIQPDTKNLNKNNKYIYISRIDAHDSKNRTITNPDLFSNLTNLGFEIIEASNYNSQEKKQLFTNGKLFILESGASVMNTIFFPKKSNVIIIESQKLKLDNLHLIEWVNLWIKYNLYFLELNVILFRDTGASVGNHQPYKINMDSFITMVKKHI